MDTHERKMTERYFFLLGIGLVVASFDVQVPYRFILQTFALFVLAMAARHTPAA